MSGITEILDDHERLLAENKELKRVNKVKQEMYEEQRAAYEKYKKMFTILARNENGCPPNCDCDNCNHKCEECFEKYFMENECK
ncbi:hypothetical protein [[Eubacterium] hominis]|uniref:hypothetical protein n=1 Tax=[Eubacterium] hominis TaxID=2764325 RepID=UPI0022E49B21